MHVVVLSTSTNNVPSLISPLWRIAHVDTIFYDRIPSRQALPDMVKPLAPDWVLLVGAFPDHHEGAIRDIEIFATIGARFPLVHLCCDGVQPVWWPVLQDYYDRGRFALQINIDGVRTGPIGERGLTALTPVYVSRQPPKPHSMRPIACGFSGSVTKVREAFLNQVSNVVTVRQRDHDVDDIRYKAFLSMCRTGINFAMTDESCARMHVKGRPLELAAAGCLVLESAGSPLEDWFTPGEDYRVYTDAEDLRRQLEWADGNPGESECMALRMRAKVAARHSPAIFWSQVLERLGRGKALRAAADVPFRPWRTGPPAAAAPPLQPQPQPKIYPQPPSLSPVPSLVAGLGPRPLTAPRLVGSLRGSNLVQWGNRVWVVPQSLGPLDLDKVDLRQLASVRVYSDVLAARQAAAGA